MPGQIWSRPDLLSSSSVIYSRQRWSLTTDQRWQRDYRRLHVASWRGCSGLPSLGRCTWLPGAASCTASGGVVAGCGPPFSAIANYIDIAC
jgi:hypothetical protein